MGPGLPLYFEFIIFAIFLLVTAFLIEGIFGLISNSGGNYCVNESLSTERCINNAISTTSIANIINDKQSYYIKSWLNFFTILIIFGFLQIFRRHQRLTDREIDRGLTSASDYSIMITKLPIGEYDEATLLEFVTQLWATENPKAKPIRIVRIIIAYNISKYMEVIKKIERLKSKKNQAEGFLNLKGKYPSGFNLEAINNEMNILLDDKAKLENEINKGSIANSCGVAFVTFGCQEGIIFFFFSSVLLFKIFFLIC